MAHEKRLKLQDQLQHGFYKRFGTPENIILNGVHKAKELMNKAGNVAKWFTANG